MSSSALRPALKPALRIPAQLLLVVVMALGLLLASPVGDAHAATRAEKIKKATNTALRQIGDPYLRSARDGRRIKDEGGLGLGLFIAKTLLERTGATLRFGNGREGGAVARMSWALADLVPGEPEEAEAPTN